MRAICGRSWVESRRADNEVGRLNGESQIAGRQKGKESGQTDEVLSTA